MKKTALILAVLLFAAMPVTAAFAAAASTRAVMVFGEPVAVESEKPAAEEIPAETIEAIETIEAVDLEMSNCFAPQVQEALTEFVFNKNTFLSAPEETKEKFTEESVDEPTVETAEDEDDGLLASAFIDSSTPLLQKPSGTLATGPFAPSKITLTDEERDYVERVIYSEVSGYSRIDALAVAQCIYDRCITYNKSVMEVLTQKYQFARPTYKYEPTKLVKQAVSDVFDKGVRLTEEKILYFYALYVIKTDSFHESQRCLIETKIHRYFGPW